MLASFVLMLFKVESEVCTFVIYTNQVLLLICVMGTTPSPDLLSFMTAMQVTKLDFKVLDSVFYLRTAANRLFDVQQFVSLEHLYFESGSTTSNFVNLIMVSIIYVIMVMTAKVARQCETRSRIRVLTPYIDMYFNAAFYRSSLKLGYMYISLN
mmetsp:Transcript_29493/g.33791  ORF Transcript_29493/g.33791 Transcript_29493/m.33791 type:complete len:154 (-) Transcript_29493:570-1031(-)